MSISLNDHEQRIKNIDDQIPVINNKISSLEQNKPSVVTKTFKTSAVRVPEYQWGDVTSQVGYNFTANTWLSGSLTIYESGLDFEWINIPLTKQPYEVTTISNNTLTRKIKIANNRVYIYYTNKNYSAKTCGLRGTFKCIELNTYYVFSKISSLFKEVISCLLA